MIRSLIFCLGFFFISTASYSFSVNHRISQSRQVIAIQTAQIDQDQEKKTKGKKQESQQPKQPEIKAVPKAKKQVKPIAIKPNVKVKQIKIVKPRIKRP